MPEQSSASLEQLLEAAETSVAGPRPSARTVHLALVSSVFFLVLVSLILGVASGGEWGAEIRLLDLLVPRQMTAESYRNRLRIVDTDTDFRATPFDTQEVHVSGTVLNTGSQIVSGGAVVLRLEHLFRDQTYEYRFPLVDPAWQAPDGAGPLLAESSRTFHFRVPDFPADITARDVRARWDLEDIELSTDLLLSASPAAPVL